MQLGNAKKRATDPEKTGEHGKYISGCRRSQSEMFPADYMTVCKDDTIGQQLSKVWEELQRRIHDLKNVKFARKARLQS